MRRIDDEDKLRASRRRWNAFPQEWISCIFAMPFSSLSTDILGSSFPTHKTTEWPPRFAIIGALNINISSQVRRQLQINNCEDCFKNLDAKIERLFFVVIMRSLQVGSHRKLFKQSTQTGTAERATWCVYTCFFEVLLSLHLLVCVCVVHIDFPIVVAANCDYY